MKIYFQKSLTAIDSIIIMILIL